jgi:hypothetical protein
MIKQISERLKQKKIRKFIRQNNKLYIYEDQVRIFKSDMKNDFGMLYIIFYNYKQESKNIYLNFQRLPEVDDVSLQMNLFEQCLVRLK